MKKIAALLTALALALGLCACSAKGESGKGELVTWQGQYDLGARYLSEGSYEEAIIAFTAAIEIDPRLASAYVSRGDAYVGYAQTLIHESNEALEAYENAVQDYLTALDLDDSDASVYQKAAEAYIALGDKGSATRILERGLRITGDQSLQEALDRLDGVIDPGELTQGSERWNALEDFLLYFAWYGDYDRETDTGAGTRNILKDMLTVPLCYSYNDAIYPGEAWQEFWDEPDPLEKWDSYMNSYIKVNAAKLEWILRYIFNCSRADIETMKRPILAGEDESIYYLDGYYYFWVGGVGSGFDVSVTRLERRGMRYYVEYTLYNYGTPEARCAVVSLKEINGKEYWTLYSCRALEYAEMDWQTRYRQFVFNSSYLQYGGPYNEGGGWGTDYNPITFSLRDLSGDGIPELIVYNGCDYEAGAYYNVFTVGPAEIQYAGSAGFRIGGFTYKDNPNYPGLFYQNGNMGYYPGCYYYMENGTVISEQVFIEELIFDGEDYENVVTQTTSDDALFDEFQNGSAHALAAYTMEDLYPAEWGGVVGWDAFVRETGGQAWS